MSTTSIISLAKTTALITFSGGTLLLLAFYLSMNFEIAIMGLIYGVIMTLVNFAMIIAIVIRSYRNKVPRLITAKSIGVMFINLPVCLLYCWVGITLSNYVRITFVNPHKVAITNLKISGCSQMFIPHLAPGESKTVWINIPNDCGVSINYQTGQQVKQEDVTGYVTNNGGYITTFYINTGQKPYDHDL